MEGTSEFVWSVIASTAGTTLLLGCAGFLFRTQISHWLNKDLEKIKAGYQRDLETYRVSLIADAERAKARQEVKTATALMIADKRFKCISRLHQAVEGFAPKVFVLFELYDEQTRKADVIEASDAQTELIAAAVDAHIFLHEGEKMQLFELAELFGEACMEAHKLRAPASESMRSKYYAELGKLQNQATSIVAAHINAMLAMD